MDDGPIGSISDGLAVSGCTTSNGHLSELSCFHVILSLGRFSQLTSLIFLFFLQIKHLHKECELEVILRGMNRMVLRSSSGVGKCFPLRRGNNEPKGGRA